MSDSIINYPVKLSFESREKIWVRYFQVETKVRMLKAIVQNPVPIYQEDISENMEITRKIIEELQSISEDLENIMSQQ